MAEGGCFVADGQEQALCLVCIWALSVKPGTPSMCCGVRSALGPPVSA